MAKNCCIIHQWQIQVTPLREEDIQDIKNYMQGGKDDCHRTRCATKAAGSSLKDMIRAAMLKLGSRNCDSI